MKPESFEHAPPVAGDCGCADNATLKANQFKLETAITEQNKVLEQQKEDFTAILESNKKLNTLINTYKQI